jgi:hypothetical protein
MTTFLNGNSAHTARWAFTSWSQPSVARVHAIVLAFEPWDDQGAGQKADILRTRRCGRRGRSLTGPPSTPHLERFTAKLIDVLATLGGAGPP